MSAITALIASLSLTASGSPALTVEWGATPAPHSTPGGPSYCMLWGGRTQPMLNFSLYAHHDHGRPELLMAAPWLEGRSNRAIISVRVEFPDGSVIERHGQYHQAGPHMTVTRMPSLDAVLDGLSRPGVVTVSTGGEARRFAVPELGSHLGAMRACVARLQSGAQE